MKLHPHRNPVFHQILSRKVRAQVITKRQSRFGFKNPTADSHEFIPVTIPSTKDPEQDQVLISSPDQKIEISFPDGIRIILSGNDSLSAARSILSIV
ncbi:MAG: hypothetical protein U9N86_11320 [Bacteroidota bacterium]|nr:hypothetical protein [Bacteroidota bacterium]